MTIDEHIIANDVLREISELLPTPFLKEHLVNQTTKGIAKYGTTVNVDDYDVFGWIDHNIQELIDSTVYYKVTIKKIEKQYGFEGVHARIIRILEREIRENIKKLESLELFRNHYLEESK